MKTPFHMRHGGMFFLISNILLKILSFLKGIFEALLNVRMFPYSSLIIGLKSIKLGVRDFWQFVMK
jgi:hypothetical protein